MAGRMWSRWSTRDDGDLFSRTLGLEREPEPVEPEAATLVVMRCCAEGYEVRIEPPTATGDLRQCFVNKSEAWKAAQSIWSEHRTGFLDLTQDSERRGRPHGK